MKKERTPPVAKNKNKGRRSRKLPEKNSNSETPQKASYYEERKLAYRGPIPDPHTLNLYNQIDPDLTNRIVTMAERQQEHRFKLESTALNGNEDRATLGLWFGFILAVILFMSAVVLIYAGKTGSGFTVLGSAATSIIGSFVYAKKTRRKNLDNHNGN